jgi:hypothetical protein
MAKKRPDWRFAPMRKAADRVGLTVPWIRAQIAKGNLTKYKSGKSSHCITLIDLNELEALIQKG